MTKLPDWLFIVVAGTLTGEIYPAIRAIAVGYSPKSKVLLFRAYFDREPTKDDIENMEVVVTNISSTTNRDQIATAEIECIHSKALMGALTHWMDSFSRDRKSRPASRILKALIRGLTKRSV